ncbi:MAG: DUF6447 family protein [Pseudomonadota bacterium]
MAEQEKRSITIDGQEYDLANLSENARQQVMNLRVTDQEIERLKQRMAIAQTARTAYANVLKGELPKLEH